MVKAILDATLVIDPNDVNADGVKVIAAEWTGDAREYHPDVALIPDATLPQHVANPDLSRNIGAIRQVLGL